MDFCEVPELDSYHQVGLTVVHADILRSLLRPEQVQNLSESQRADVEYHRPGPLATSCSTGSTDHLSTTNCAFRMHARLRREHRHDRADRGMSGSCLVVLHRHQVEHRVASICPDR